MQRTTHRETRLFDSATHLLGEIGQDLRYGLRTLARSPGFAAVALISLSLGICIATCAISEINGMVLRNLPGVASPNQLVAVLAPTSYPNYTRYRDERALFSSTAAYVAPVPFAVSLGGKTERSWGHLVTASYFSTFGTAPILGRTFVAEDDQPGRAPTVVVSQRYWRQHLGADASIVGRTVTINGHPATLIGVAGENFLGASPFIFPADLWMPLSVGPSVAPELTDNALNRRDVSMFRVVGRLQPGVTRNQAEAALDAITQQLQRDNAEQESERKGRRLLLVEGGKLLPLRTEDQPFFTSFLLLMAGLVMLIACSNVANMMLARAMDRRREMAVRLSLGAGRARLVRQLITENMIVAGTAGVIGFCTSAWLMHLLSRLKMPFPMPVAYDFAPDGRVLLLTIALTVSTGMLFGLAPALQATAPEIASALKGGSDLRLRRFRSLSLRNLLMIAQVAGSLSLLVMLGMLAWGIQSTMGIKAGFNAESLSMLSVDPVRDGYPREGVADFFNQLLERIQKLPEIRSVCLTESVPVSLANQRITVSLPGSTNSRILDSAVKHVVGKDYFATTGIPIRLGRFFSKQDETSDTAAVIVSEAFVRQVWPGENPVGQRIEVGSGNIIPAKILPGSFDYRSEVVTPQKRTFEVVGVAGDIAEGLVVQKPSPAIYLPLHPSDYERPSLQGVTLIMRAPPGVNAIAAAQREIGRLSGKVTPFNGMNMQEHIDQFMSPLRMAAWTYALIGVFGLVLASVGLGGMTAYSVTQRRHEIAVRMALGARRSDVLSLVIGQAACLLLIGTVTGMALAWGSERAITAMSSTVGRVVNSTSSSDPTILIGAPMLLSALALLACYLPARKSVNINPVVALRQE